MTKVKVYAALHADIDSDSVWVQNVNGISERGLVRIRPYGKLCPSIYVEAHVVDSNFCKQYKDAYTNELEKKGSALVINEHYRRLLNLKTDTESELEFDPKSGPYADWRATQHHPMASIDAVSKLLKILF